MEAPPLYEGRQPLGGGWWVVPPYPMAIREEDGSTVIWHSPRGLSLWISVYGADPGTTAADTLEWVLSGRSEDAWDEIEEQGPVLLRYGYRLDDSDAACPTFYGAAIAPDGGYALLGAYFEDEASLADAMATWRSFEWKP
ncbi:hypothetical protein P1X14_05055 [Sphingomonas sp. AOB5]|uniref:hypothetical protein n=1 Tax=Sphingomonas sp. AOB5 TaxID=3034017 RepID=UPI0023F8A283|nr:hypothetical protein [Sphingomonas sp. AOB5]MDF7774607.1 hypothetical protein [Sphingomonas sp. AOB5]